MSNELTASLLGAADTYARMGHHGHAGELHEAVAYIAQLEDAVVRLGLAQRRADKVLKLWGSTPKELGTDMHGVVCRTAKEGVELARFIGGIAPSVRQPPEPEAP